VETLRAKGVKISSLKPANCGFTVDWSDIFRDRFEGEPLKSIALSFGGRTVRGEAVISAENSTVTVRVIPPAEDLMIVNHVVRLMGE